MATRGKITEIYDISNIQQQQDKVVTLLNQSVKIINEFPKIKVELEGAEKTKAILDGMKKVTDVTNQVTTAVNGTANAYEKMIADARQATAANGQMSASYLDNIKKLVELKAQLSAVSGNVKTLGEFYKAAKDNISLRDELAAQVAEQNKLKLSIQEVTKTMNNQTKEINTGSGSLVEMRAQLNQLNQAYDHLDEVTRNSDIGAGLLVKIQGLDAALKQTEGSTGRFQRNVGNYTSATVTLGKALDDVKKQIEANTNSGEKNQGVIDQLIKEQQLLETLVQNQAAGFASLTTEIKANENAMVALKAANLEDSEAYKVLFAETAKAKDELASFKKELATRGQGDLAFQGAIQAAQTLAGAYGAAQGAIALFGDESEELMQLMVKLQAVLAILNGLESINNALKKESALRTTIKVGLQRVELIQTRLQTAAESKNIIVKYASVVAQKALNAVMALTPTGILIAGLAGLAAALVAFSSRTNEAVAAQKRFNLELDDAVKWNDRLRKADADAGSERLSEMKSRFATEKQLRDENIKSIEQQLASVQELEDAKRSGFDAANSALRATTDKDEAERLQKTVETFNGIQEKRQELEHQLAIERNNNARADSEELLDIEKQTAEGRILLLKRQADAQQALADNDEKTYEERKKALTNAAALQIQIANLQKQQVASDPRSNRKDIIAAEQTAQDAILRIRKTANDKNIALTKEQVEREKAAAFELTKLKVQASADAAREIADNEENESTVRLEALAKNYTEVQKLIIAQRDYELQNTKLLESEKIVIRNKANEDILKNQRQFLKDYYQLAHDAAEQEYDKESARNTARQNNEIAGAKQRRRKLFETEQDVIDKERIKQSQYDLESLNNQQSHNEQMLNLAIQYGKDTAQIELQISQTKLGIINKTNEIAKLKHEENVKYLKRYSDAALEAVNMVGQLLNAGWEREKNRIQEQIDLIEKKKAAEIEAAQAAAGSEEEKAAKIKIIEARAQSQREALELRQRQIEQKKARFDKAMNIAAIIQETALAVVRALGQVKTMGPAAYALAAGIGALGAAKLAVAVATPIPKYKLGIEDHPGGPAIVGDGGKRELVTVPSGRNYITSDKPTLVNLPKGSKVLPDADAAMKDLQYAAFRRLPAESINERNYSKEMTAALVGEISKLNATVKNKSETHLLVTFAGQTQLQKKAYNFSNWLNSAMKSGR